MVGARRVAWKLLLLRSRVSFPLVSSHRARPLMRTGQRQEKEGRNAEKEEDQMKCGAFDWILEQKKDASKI